MFLLLTDCNQNSITTWVSPLTALTLKQSFV